LVIVFEKRGEPMKVFKTIPHSLHWRLAIASLVWLPVALVASGLALVEIFRHYASDVYRQSLMHDAAHIAETLNTGGMNAVSISRLLPDSRYQLRYSGRYWQIDIVDAPSIRSDSLSDFRLSLPEKSTPQSPGRFASVKGPNGQELLAFAQIVDIVNAHRRATILVASDRRQLNVTIDSFRSTLAISLLVLGVGLLIAVFMQINIGLSPLRKLRAAVEELKRGNTSELESAWPSELAPLADDLKSVAFRNRQLVERAKSGAQNLAHGLKTPLAVLMNHARDGESCNSDDVQKQLHAMRNYIERHLARTNAGTSSLEFRGRIDARRTILRIAETLSRLHPEKTLHSKFFAESLSFLGSEDDLSDIVGNILENAFIWARKSIELEVFDSRGSLAIHIADDGPGIPEDRRDEVLQRGVRFDETAPGSGFGIPIADDMIKLYGGRLVLDQSRLGGLMVKIYLPLK
jgi:signal transduction histidine kinase